MPADPSALTPFVQDVFPGATISLLDCGGFACTFRVQQGTDDLAAKFIDPTQSTTPIREDREVIALQSVNHPNVVRYRDTGTHTRGARTVRYLVMDFIEGESLRSMFNRSHAFGFDELATIAEDIAAATRRIEGHVEVAGFAIGGDDIGVDRLDCLPI